MEREILREIGVKIKEIHAGKVVETTGIVKNIQELHQMVDCKDRLLLVEQEFVELEAFKEFVENKRIPGLEEFSWLKNHVEAYVLGLLDFTGEVKRYSLDRLLDGDLERAKEGYEIMREIYYELKTLVFPDFVLPRFRPKLDVLRIQLESLGETIGRKIP
jgi:translin